MVGQLIALERHVGQSVLMIGTLFGRHRIMISLVSAVVILISRFLSSTLFRNSDKRLHHRRLSSVHCTQLRRFG